MLQRKDCASHWSCSNISKLGSSHQFSLSPLHSLLIGKTILKHKNFNGLLFIRNLTYTLCVCVYVHPQHTLYKFFIFENSKWSWSGRLVTMFCHIACTFSLLTGILIRWLWWAESINVIGILEYSCSLIYSDRLNNYEGFEFLFGFDLYVWNVCIWKWFYWLL